MPDRLVILWNRSPGLGITEDWFSTAQYFDIKTSHRGLEQVAIAIGDNYNLTGAVCPSASVSSTSRRICCRCSARGPSSAGCSSRTRTPPGGAAARRPRPRDVDAPLGRRSGVVGRTIVLNGESTEMVGVLPASFSLRKEVIPTLYGAADAEIMLPLPLVPTLPRFAATKTTTSSGS